MNQQGFCKVQSGNNWIKWYWSTYVSILLTDYELASGVVDKNGMHCSHLSLPLDNDCFP